MMSTSSALAALRRFLDARDPGAIHDREGLIDHLAPAWGDLDGADDTRMEPWKLRRLEDPTWSPPRLSFVVERHGATVLGSTRAALQGWTVDLDAGIAYVEERRFRQLRPRAPRLEVGPIADEIVAIIVAGGEDDRLRWSADRDSVRILAGTIIPAGYAQTTAGRRKRLGEALAQRLEEAGWERGSNRWTYIRPGSAGP
jgi:hypothetical protein